MDQDKMGHFSTDEKDALIRLVHKVIRLSVKSLAVLSTFVIVWSIMDVVWVMYRRLSQPPILVLSPNDILFIFGALLVVLIAIGIFINITLYLREDVIHVKLVIATALMAIARKVIVLDYRRSVTNMFMPQRRLCCPWASPIGLLRERLELADMGLLKIKPGE